MQGWRSGYGLILLTPLAASQECISISGGSHFQRAGYEVATIGSLVLNEGLSIDRYAGGIR